MNTELCLHQATARIRGADLGPVTRSCRRLGLVSSLLLSLVPPGSQAGGWL